MLPILFQLGTIQIASWYVFVSLGIFLAYLYAHHLVQSKLVNFNCTSMQFELIFVVSMLSAWIGARGLSIVVEQFDIVTWKEFALELLRPGPMTFFGGAIFGGLSLWALCSLFLKIPIYHAISLGSLPLVLGLGVGRIGCHLNGDDYGKVHWDGSRWWTITIPHLDSLPRYPVQLEESLFCLSLFITLHFTLKKRPESILGCSFVSIFLMCINRFINEFYRGDPRGHLGWLSTSQILSIAIVLLLIIPLAHFYKSTVKPNKASS